ncbi:MAG: hypothetical protein U0R64_03160 [Candidatus Nanopelagicales bacterium]
MTPRPSSVAPRWRAVLAGGTALTLAVGVLAGCGAGDSADTVSREAGTSTKTLVMLGDSYMSGEAGRIASNLYVKKAQKERDVDEEVGGVTVGGFDVYDQKQDADVPATPYCHRTTSAPGFIGNGWTTINLACSGAETVSNTFTLKDGKTSAWKPGIDYGKNLNGDIGQARMLEQIATDTPVDAVALSIGGNNFNFSGLISFCVEKYILSQNCSEKEWAKSLISDAKAKEVQEAIEAALFNVQRAMFTADVAYREKPWKLVYQLPPLPMSSHDQNAFGESLNERSDGGCYFRDKDLDWFGDTAAKVIRNTMVKAVSNFYSSGKKKGAWTLTVIDDSNAFDQRRLCDKTTDRKTTTVSPGIQNPPDWEKVGKNAEWISEIKLWDQIFNVPNRLHLATEPMHPTYWGQRALASCMRLAIEDTRTDQVLYCERGDGTLRGDGTPAMKIAKADTPYTQLPGLDQVGLPEIFGEGRHELDHLQYRAAGSATVQSWAITKTTITKDVGGADEIGRPRALIATLEVTGVNRMASQMKVTTQGFLTKSAGGANEREGKYGQRRYIDGSTKIVGGGVECSGRSEFMMVGRELRYLRVEPNTGCEVLAW